MAELHRPPGRPAPAAARHDGRTDDGPGGRLSDFVRGVPIPDERRCYLLAGKPPG